MSRLLQILTLALVLQLALAVALYLHNTNDGVRAEPLLASVEGVDRIVLGDGEQEVTLSTTEEGWQVVELDGLPADKARIEGALERLAKTKVNYPVTTTSAAHQRFELAADHYQRRVQLFAGDEERGELYLGTSPGFRQVHLRRAGDEEVYVVALNSFDYPVDPQQWLDKGLLALDAPERIEGPDFTLVRADGAWQLASGEPVDQARAEALAGAISGLSVIGTVQPLAGTGVQYRELTVTAAGQTVTYLFQSSESDYRVSRSDRPGVYSLAAYDHDRLAGVALADLVAEAAEEAEAPTAGSPDK